KQIRIVKLANSNRITIVDEAGAGTSTMRFKGIGNTATPNIVLRHDGSNVLIEYDLSAARWFVVAWNPGIATTDNAGYVEPSTSLVMSGSQLQNAASSGGHITRAQNSNTYTVTNAVLTPAMLAVLASAVGVPFVVYAAFTAGTPGTADDVTIFPGALPVAFRILDVQVITSTPIATSTITLRTATGGGGSALSSAIPSAAAGTQRNNDTATRTCALGTLCVARRS